MYNTEQEALIMSFQELLANILGASMAAAVCDSMAERLVILGRDLRHMDHCTRPESCPLCRDNKEAIRENVPRWAQDLARVLDKNPAMQLRAVWEQMSGREIADALGVTIDMDEAA